MNEVGFTAGKTPTSQTGSESNMDKTSIPNLYTITTLIQHFLSVSEQKELEAGLSLTADSINVKPPLGVRLFVQRAMTELKIDNLIQALCVQHPDLPCDEIMCASGLVSPEPIRIFDWYAISDLLQDVFLEPAQFDAFLRTSFPDFTKELGEEIAVSTKARKLVLYCNKRDSLSQLLSVLQSEFPDRYEALAPYTRSENATEKKEREGVESLSLQKESMIVLDREMTRREQQLPQSIALVKKTQLPAQKRRKIWGFVWMDDDLVLNMFQESIKLLAHDSMEIEAVSFMSPKHLLKLPQKNRLLAIGSMGNHRDTYLEVWDLGTRTKKVAIRNEKMLWLKAVTCTPDGKTAVTAHEDNTLRFWNLVTGQKIDEWHGHPREIRGLAISPDGEYLISFGWDNTLRVWDFDKGSQIMTMDVPGRIARTVLSQDGSMLAAHYDIGSEIYIYRLEYKTSGLFSKKREAKVRLMTKLINIEGGADRFSFSADGRFFAATIGARITKIWRTDDWSVYATLPHSPGSALAFHSKRPLLATTHQDGLGVRILQIE